MRASLLLLLILAQAALAQENCRVQVTHNRKCQLRYRRLVGNPTWREVRFLSNEELRSEIELPCEAVELEARDDSSWLLLYTARRQLRADPGSVQFVLEPSLRPQVLPLLVTMLAAWGLARVRRRQKLRESILNEKLEQSRQDLSQKEIRDSLAWQFANGMAKNASPTALCEYAVTFLRNELGYDCAAVVDCRSGKPLVFGEKSVTVHLNEVALQCFRSQRPTWLLGRQISASHPFSLLFPLGQFGVLYAGRARAQNLEEAENLLMGAIAVQLRLALEIGQTFQENQERLANLMESSKSAAVGQLAAGLAHELNSPLGAISLLLERALVVAKDPVRLETQLTRAHQSLDKARQIISRLLFYSREGSQHGTSLDLNQIIEDTVGFLHGEFARLQVELKVNLQPLPLLSGNAHDLQQCLVNLLVNAQAAVAQGEVRVRSLCEDGHAKVWVEDNGKGIDPENSERIFEPFFTTRPVGQGVGLGLCVARRIAENHHGRLTLVRSDSTGTSFLLEVPLSG